MVNAWSRPVDGRRERESALAVPSTRHLLLEAVSPCDAMGFIVPTPGAGQPAFEGGGELDYRCATCGLILCRGAKRGLFAGMIFRCVACNKLNRVPGAPPRLSPFE